MDESATDFVYFVQRTWLAIDWPSAKKVEQLLLRVHAELVEYRGEMTPKRALAEKHLRGNRRYTFSSKQARK